MDDDDVAVTTGDAVDDTPLDFDFGFDDDDFFSSFVALFLDFSFDCLISFSVFELCLLCLLWCL